MLRLSMEDVWRWDGSDASYDVPRTAELSSVTENVHRLIAAWRMELGPATKSSSGDSLTAQGEERKEWMEGADID